VSFKPFKFIFNPPPTLPSPDGDTAAKPQPEDLVSASDSHLTNAGQLIDQLDEMIESSKYLQQAIVTRYRDKGVEMGFDANPEIASALSRIFGVDTPPEIVTIPMFDHLLDAEIGAVNLEMALDAGSTIQPNPIQVADLSLVTAQVERYLISTGMFDNQVPVLLRSLKADQLIFTHWQNGLRDYPVIRQGQSPTDLLSSRLVQPGPIQGTIRAANVDLTNAGYNYLSGYLNRYSGIYASVYQFMAQVSHIERDISSVVSVFVLQPIADLTRMVALFNGLKGLFHKDSLQGIADAIGGFVFARMSAEVGVMSFIFDRFINMAVSPLRNAIGGVGRLLNIMNSVVRSVGTAVQGLKGLSKTNACGRHMPHNQGTDRYSHSPISIPGLSPGSALPEALQTLGEHLAWASSEGDRKRRLVDNSFRKLNERRLGEQRDRLDIMCSMQSLDSLIGLATGFINESQRGTSFATASQSQKIEALGRILANLKTNSTATFTVEDGEISIAPVDLIPPPIKVEKVLRRGGLKRITRDDVIHIKGIVS
jgi:hypothetical protein